MGGSTFGVPYKDVWLFKDGIFTQQADLPEPMTFFSAVMLDSNTLFVASSTKTNYLLDINTFQWTPIASRTIADPGSDHVSGTFYNSVDGELQIATVMYDGIQIYSPRNDQWRNGDPWPVNVDGFGYTAAVQQGADSFYMIGGLRDSFVYESDLFEFDQTGFHEEIPYILGTTRRYHVALSIPSSHVPCSYTK